MLYEDQMEHDRQDERKIIRRKAQEVREFASKLCEDQKRKSATGNLVRLWEEGKTGEIIAIGHAEAGLGKVVELFRFLSSHYETSANHVDTREPVKLRGFRQKYDILRRGIEHNIGAYLEFKLAEQTNMSLAHAAYKEKMFILGMVPGNIQEMTNLAGKLHYSKEHLVWCEQVGMTPDGQVAEKQGGVAGK